MKNEVQSSRNIVAGYVKIHNRITIWTQVPLMYFIDSFQYTLAEYLLHL